MNYTPFMSIKDACAYTGLSTGYLRKGVKDGTVPAIMSGNKYLVNIRKLMEKLDRESEATNDKMA